MEEVEESLADKLMRECSLSDWDGSDGCCRWCGKKITNVKRWRWCSNACRLAFERNHVWKRARAWAKRSAKYECIVDGCDVGGRGALDVHHLSPRMGRGYAPGCHAHQDNLAVLCKEHHKVETARERLELKGTVRKRNSAAVEQGEQGERVASKGKQGKRGKQGGRGRVRVRSLRKRGDYAGLIPQIDFNGRNT